MGGPVSGRQTLQCAPLTTLNSLQHGQDFLPADWGISQKWDRADALGPSPYIMPNTQGAAGKLRNGALARCFPCPVPHAQGKGW